MFLNAVLTGLKVQLNKTGFDINISVIFLLE